MTIDDFFRAVDSDNLKTIDRALGILWFTGREDPTAGLTSRRIADVIEKHGHPALNISRLDRMLSDSRDTAKAAAGAWRLVPKARNAFNAQFEDAIAKPKLVLLTDSVLPRSLFDGSPRYIEGVVHQINGSYDCGYYDCAAVMCRRLLETLIIDVYETSGRATEVKGADGNFLMFAGLLAHLEKDVKLHISRNGMTGLRDFKRIGDLSAHNRRFNAHKNDIDRIRDGLRVASGELLVMAALGKTRATAT